MSKMENYMKYNLVSLHMYTQYHDNFLDYYEPIGSAVQS